MSKIPAGDTTKSIVGHGLWLEKNINGEKSGVNPETSTDRGSSAPPPGRSLKVDSRSPSRLAKPMCKLRHTDRVPATKLGLEAGAKGGTSSAGKA